MLAWDWPPSWLGRLRELFTRLPEKSSLRPRSHSSGSLRSYCEGMDGFGGYKSAMPGKVQEIERKLEEKIIGERAVDVDAEVGGRV